MGETQGKENKILHGGPIATRRENCGRKLYYGSLRLGRRGGTR